MTTEPPVHFLMQPVTASRTACALRMPDPAVCYISAIVDLVTCVPCLRNLAREANAEGAALHSEVGDAPVDWTPVAAGAWAKRLTPQTRFSGVLERKSRGHFWVTLVAPVEVRAVTLAASASEAAGLSVHAEWIGIGPYRDRFSLSVVDPRGRLTDPEALEFEVRAVVPGADVTEAANGQ